MSQRIESAQDTSTTDSEQQYLPARMLNEFIYCPRLFYLEHVDGLFTHNADTIEGVAKHKRVDQKTDELPNAETTQAHERIHARSVTLSSDSFGVIAKMDLIEVQGNIATSVDYEQGAPRKMPDGTLEAWDPERVQLCVQALVLRENGYECSEGVVFFWETRQRVRTAIDDDLMELTRKAIAEANELSDRLVAPPPLRDFQVAAPLKLPVPPKFKPCRTDFRDFQVAAPLKQRPLGKHGRFRPTFRDFQVAAPLKQPRFRRACGNSLLSATSKSRLH